LAKIASDSSALFYPSPVADPNRFIRDLRRITATQYGDQQPIGVPVVPIGCLNN